MQENNQNLSEDNQEELKQENMEKNDSSSKGLIILLVAIIIVLLAGGGYLYYSLSSKITDLETDLDVKDQKVEQQIDDDKDEDIDTVKDDEDEEVKEPEEEEDEPEEEPVVSKEIEYYNSDYGFGFTLPATWKGYRVKEEDTSWGDFKAKSLYFGFEAQEGLFAVSIFTHEQWDKLQGSPDARQVSKLGENSKYVFAWSHSQYLENDEMEKRASEIQDIIKTFYTDAK